MVELASAQDEAVAVFRMTSRHHGCQIDAGWADQRLDPGEQRWVLPELTVLELLAAEPT